MSQSVLLPVNCWQGPTPAPPHPGKHISLPSMPSLLPSEKFVLKEQGVYVCVCVCVCVGVGVCVCRE